MLPCTTALFFRGTRRSAVGGKFGHVIAHDERNIAPVAPEYREACRIGAECRSPFAVRGDGVGRDIGPTSHDLLFERLLLAEGGGRKERKPQAGDCTQAQNAKTIGGGGRQAWPGWGPPVLLVAPEEHVGFIFFTTKPNPASYGPSSLSPLACRHAARQPNAEIIFSKGSFIVPTL